jgi:hypothetical protein
MWTPLGKDIKGLKFGRLTALEQLGKNEKNSFIWKCICECGNYKNCTVKQLTCKRAQSCGCLVKPNHEQHLELMKKKLLSSHKIVGDCWEWQGLLRKDGYGTVGFKRKTSLPHRLSYIVFKGPIPDGMLILHSCDNRKCINPDHLRIGTYSDNLNDMWSKKRRIIKKLKRND